MSTSREAKARARASAAKVNATGRVAGYLADEALDESHVGNLAGAKQLAKQSLDVAGPEGIAQRTALALALTGDIAAAGPLLQNLAANPKDILVQGLVAPTVRAIMEMKSGNPARAFELLQPALKYEMGIAEVSALEPAYVRGRSRACSADAPLRWPATSMRRGRTTRTSSRSGRTPIPTCRSSGRRRRSTES